MKTTVEVPDSLYREVKARAALRGQSIKTFFLEALREKLSSSPAKTEKETGWQAVFGKADKQDMARLQKIIDEECRKIEYSEWGLSEPEEPA